MPVLNNLLAEGSKIEPRTNPNASPKDNSSSDSWYKNLPITEEKENSNHTTTVSLPPLESSVTLRDPFDYTPLFFIVTATALGLILLYEIYRFFIRHHTKKPKEPKIVTPPPKALALIKEEYLTKLSQLEQNLPNLTVREAYQKLSPILRLFIFEATGIKVQNFSLQEIANLNCPPLTQLVDEYYTPEFAYESRGDISLSIEKSRQLIWSWN